MPPGALCLRQARRIRRRANCGLFRGEGVEQDDQLAFLRERGCDRVQGHLFSPPLTGEQMLDYILDAPKVQATADSQ
jgi:EAL domain-containing protein (putative c-di-GMP-specific phosphodiesterase class I)